MESFTNESIYILVPMEIAILKALWFSDAPKTLGELYKKHLKPETKKTYQHFSTLMKGLRERGYVEVTGRILVRTQYAMQYKALLSRERYQQYLLETYFKDDVPSDALLTGLVSVQENKERYVKELKAKVKELQGE